ncbi:MAG TPA: hypothetical protein VGL37_06060 [Solirubrobacteraceae bacterium]
MAERLFLFVQMEFPWQLGPADGRYLLRGYADGEPERVVVLETVGAARAVGRLAARRRPPVEPKPEPQTVASTRATVIDPVSVSAERQAQAWLAELDAERETRTATAALNRMLAAYRVATADPYLHELTPSRALTVRAGWGEGEQVAYGDWLHARELRWREPRGPQMRRGLRAQEHLAALLGAREPLLLCEELALRARHDLDAGRLRHAALELDHAYAAALGELREERAADLGKRVEELAELRPSVAQAARTALGEDAQEPDETQRSEGTQTHGNTQTPGGAQTPGGMQTPGSTQGPGGTREPDGETVAHALGRLEAALRARAAGGFQA